MGFVEREREEERENESRANREGKRFYLKFKILLREERETL